MVPGIPEAAMRGASVEQADSFTNGDVALHFLAALGALVQLLPATFRRFVVAHSRISSEAARAGMDRPRSGHATPGGAGRHSPFGEYDPFLTLIQREFTRS